MSASAADEEALRAWDAMSELEFAETKRRIKAALESVLCGPDEESRVRSVSTAWLTPFYGYHANVCRFARIELWRPDDVRRAGAMLCEGVDDEVDASARVGYRLQPHESHISYEMRFMVDFGVYGLAPIKLSNWRFRHAPKCAGPGLWDVEHGLSKFHKECRPENDDPDPRTLWCGRRCTSDDAIEIDAACACIELTSVDEWTGKTEPPAESRLFEDEDCVTALPSLRALWEREARRLKRDRPGLSDQNIRAELRISPVWLTPSNDDSVGSSPQAKQTPRGVPGQPLDRRDHWASALDALRHHSKQAPVLRSSSVAETALTTQASSAAEAEALLQEDEQRQQEQDELYERSSLSGDSQDEDDFADEADEEDAQVVEDQEVSPAPVTSPEHPSSWPSSTAVAREIRFTSQASSPKPSEVSLKDETGLVIAPVGRPPRRREVVNVVNQRLYYSEHADAVAKLKDFAGTKDNALWSADISALPVFDTAGALDVGKSSFACCSLMTWRRLETAAQVPLQRREYSGSARLVAALSTRPPTRGAIVRWAAERGDGRGWSRTPNLKNQSQQPSNSSAGAPGSGERGLREHVEEPPKYHCRVSVLALEVLTAILPGRFRSDPASDRAVAVVWRFREHYEDDHSDSVGCFLVARDDRSGQATAAAVERSWPLPRGAASSPTVKLVGNERQLIRGVTKLVTQMDPDVLLGWDLERESFAYLADRLSALDDGGDLVLELTRVCGAKPRIQQPEQKKDAENSPPSSFGSHGFEVIGRMSLNAWREVSRDDFARMRSYTLEAASLHLLKSKLPKFSPRRLYERFGSPSPATRAHAILHLARRCTTCLDIVTQLNTLGRAAEVARLFGLPLDEALFRGSQHRVEAVILRLAKPRTAENPVRARYDPEVGDYREDSAPVVIPGEGSSKFRRWFAFCSPTRSQVANQQALEEISLTLEPWSDVYTEPVAVLDFRSLFPSLIVAYNLCFSTLICRLKPLADELPRPPRIGRKRLSAHSRFLQHKRPRPHSANFLLDEHEEDEEDEAGGDNNDDYYGDDKQEESMSQREAAACCEELRPESSNSVTWERLGVMAYRSDTQSSAALAHAEGCSRGPVFVAPNGAVFVPTSAREGILPRALREILAARELVKGAMKRSASAGRETERRAADARQLALKLLANVIYGYCSASFSGRQPCAELADAVVSTSRETLLFAIEKAGGAARRPDAADLPVKYGDTDSLFIELRGHSRASAIAWGISFAKQISNANPLAVELKFEKIYDGCLLMAKKNYAGIKYERADDPGELECKGLAPMRRDKCAFVADTAGRIYELILRDRDLSAAKAALIAAIDRAKTGGTSIGAFVIRQEAKLGIYKRPARNNVGRVARALNERGARVLFRERVPFVFCHTTDAATQQYAKALDLEAALDNGAPIDVDIYVRMLLNTLHHVLALVGVDVRKWIRNLVRRDRHLTARRPDPPIRRANLLTDYFVSSVCSLCREAHTTNPLCDRCGDRPDLALLVANHKLRKAQRKLGNLARHCVACAADPSGRRISPTSTFPFRDGPCDSRDCKVAYERLAAAQASAHAAEQLGVLVTFLQNRHVPTTPPAPGS